MDEGMKLFASIFFSQHESAFAKAGNDQGKLLASVGGNTMVFLNKVHRAIWELHSHDPPRCCPDEDSFLLNVMKSDAVLQYWQGGLLESMPKVDFSGRGWRVAQK